MANELKAVVTADIKQFTKSMSAIGLSAGTAATAAIGAFTAVIATVVALERASLKAAQSYESLALGLKLAVRESGNANEEFKKLLDFSDRTPFDTAQLIKYSIQLRNVTSNFIGSAKSIELMSGALAKAQLLGKDETFVDSLGRIITAFQTGNGMVKRYTQTLLNTGAITADTATKILELRDAGASVDEVWEVLTQDFRRSRGALDEFAASAEGLLSTLTSVFQRTLAGGTSGEGLETYKNIVKELSDILLDIRETDAFKTLSDSFAELLANIMILIKSEGFKKFLLDTIALIKLLVDAVSILVKGLQAIAWVSGKLPQSVRSPIGAASQFIGRTQLDPNRANAGLNDIQQMQRARTEREAKILNDIKNGVQGTEKGITGTNKGD